MGHRMEVISRVRRTGAIGAIGLRLLVPELLGQDQQRAQGDEVAVGDIGLRLERSEQVGGQFLADPRQCQGHDRGV